MAIFTLADLEKQTGRAIKAVIFDLDGVLVESEEYWDEARKMFVEKRGGKWREKDQKSVMGLNSKEWARYIKKIVNAKDSEQEIMEGVKKLVLFLYKTKGLPLIKEAAALLKALSRKKIPQSKKHIPIAVATSSPKKIAKFVLKKSGVDKYVSFVVSSDEVRRGKPSPDVYLKTAKLLAENPRNILVFEDSPNGVKAAKAAGMIVVAVPNKRYRFSKSRFKKADLILPTVKNFVLTSKIKK